MRLFPLLCVLSYGLLAACRCLAQTYDPSQVTTNDIHAVCAQLTDHPRLFVRGPEGLAAIRNDPSPRAVLMRSRVISAADSALTKALTVFGKDAANKRLSGDTAATGIIIPCAAAYALTGDVRYAERARDEMLSVCAQGVNNGWVPSHYLGVAEVLRGLSFGYDWTYSALTETERATIRQAIYDYGYGGMSGWGGWDNGGNNWCQVCWQGVISAAIALYEDDAERSEALIARCVRGVIRSCSVYEPNGAYPEGPGYWNYGTRLFCLMLDSFDTAFGTNFGLYDLPGVNKTGAYLTMVQGPSGKMFNYADGGENVGTFFPAVVWLARKAERPDWSLREAKVLDADLHGSSQITGETALWTLLWGADLDVSAEDRAPLDWYGGGAAPVATLRESKRPHSMFVGIKAGSPSTSHAHMDVGSFIFEMDQQRWGVDLGSQGYASLEKLGNDVINLWNYKQDSTRWDVFRLGVSSHNVMTIDGQREDVTVNVPVDCVETGDVSVAAIDMSSVYGTNLCASARRTFTLDRTNVTFKVRDSFTGLSEGAELRWTMVTRATKTEILGDTMRLSTGGSKLDIAMDASVQGIWSVEDISVGPSYWDCENAGCVQIVYTASAPASGSADFTATFTRVAATWPAGTTFYGLDFGTSADGTATGYGNVLKAFGWWTGPDTNTATQVDVVPPWSCADNDYRYVLLPTSKTKITTGGSFPDVPLEFGQPDKNYELRFNGSLQFTFPHMKMYCGKLTGNGRGLTLFDGDIEFIKTARTIQFSASSVEYGRGVALGATIKSEADVELQFLSTFVSNYHGAATHRISGDASRFKGSYRLIKTSYRPWHFIEDQHTRFELASPSALGDSSSPRTNALVMVHNTRLVIDPAVVQDGTRGIAFSLATNEWASVHADAATAWTLSAPVFADRGTLSKTGPGKVTLGQSYRLPNLDLKEGVLGLAEGVTVTVDTYAKNGKGKRAGAYGSPEACAENSHLVRDDSLSGLGTLRVLTGPMPGITFYVR